MQKSTTSIAQVFVLSLTMMTALALSLIVATPQPVGAGAACDLPDTKGRATLDVNVETAGEYVIWSRMRAPSADGTYRINIDTTADCLMGNTGSLVGDSSKVNSSTWEWVNTDGSGGVVKVTLPVGSVRIQMAGETSGTQLDKILLLADQSCVPTEFGDNCSVSTDDVDPVSTLTAPTNGQTVSGSVTVSATATDNVGVTAVDFLVDGTLIDTDTTAAGDTYEVTWDSTGVSNGNHTLQSRAKDAEGNAGSSTVSVNVDNGGGTGTCLPEDVNKSGKVDVSDVLAVLGKLFQNGPLPEDVNGSGKVGVEDVLAVLAELFSTSDCGA